MANTYQRQARWQGAFYTVGTFFLVIAALYFARVIFLPIVLAVVVAFILNPLVSFLQQRGMPRVVAVLTILALVTVLLFGVVSLVVVQADNLMAELPQYRTHILHKLQDLQKAQPGHWRDFWETLKDIASSLPGNTKGAPVPVEVTESHFPLLQSVAGSTLEFLVKVGVVFLFVLFILINVEDLRNRALRLFGRHNLSVTTKAMDDAGQRISRFLGRQLLVNVIFGLVLGMGLFVLNLPHALVWGVLGCLLRYVPYLGAFLAAFFPMALAFAISPHWGVFLAVGGFILGLELLVGNVVEPWLYGRSVGVTAIAYLVSAIFWTWLWGPVGLILATPLTVCLVVVGRHVPALRNLAVMFGDEPALPVAVSFYQRLLAKDRAEASDLVEDYCKTHPADLAHDEIFLPALLMAKWSHESGAITDKDSTSILMGIRRILRDVVEPAMMDIRRRRPGDDSPGTTPLTVLGLFWQAEGEVSLRLTRSLMERRLVHWRVHPLRYGWRKAADDIGTEPSAVLVVSTLAVRRPHRLQRFCATIKKDFPDLTVLVHAYGQEEPQEFRKLMAQAGATDTAVTFQEGRQQLARLAAVEDVPHATGQATVAAHP